MSDDVDGQNRLESLLINLIFAAVSVALLAAIGVATRTGQATAGWWTRPALMPGVALAVLAAANLGTLVRAWRDLRAVPPDEAEWAQARTRVAAWLRPLEFLAYFAVYLYAIAPLGYFLATLLFVMGLQLRVGLTSSRWILFGLALVATLILVFRIGLGVWMPAAAIYDYAPEGIRTYLIRWF
jgi:hypothetical protein